MKILYFSRTYTTHDHRFLRKIAESQHEVIFLRLEDDGLKYEMRPLPPGVREVRWEEGQRSGKTPESCLALMPEFTRVLEEVRPDLVHAGPVQSCGFITALSGFHPWLLMSWGSDILVDSDRDPLWRWISRFTLNHADMLQCDCQAVQDKVQQLSPFPSSHIIQFPWGVDSLQLTPSADLLGIRRHLGWENAFVILSTRSWEPIYGLEVLLEAFRLAFAENSGIRLLMLGDGSLSARIHQFLEQHGLGQVVSCPGPVSQEDMPYYYRAADLYLSCSDSDGTSVSLLEAMATGLPVVLTDLPGNREWVVSGENGWLAPRGDARAFSQLLLQVASLGPEERQKFFEVNRKIVAERANWPENFKKLLNAYDQLALPPQKRN